jgi:hypothetical protein
MRPSIKVSAILTNDSPRMTQLFAMQSEPCWGDWRLVNGLDGSALDSRIHAAGWNFFFLAAEVKVMFWGAIGVAKIQNALQRILGKVKQQHFNSLEVTGIVAKHFLGVPYAVVTAHSRHIQQSCYLDSAQARQASRPSVL